MIQISEIFRSIQTEGPLAGTPAVFIRFAGCNFNCSFCDESNETKQVLPPTEIVKRVRQFAKNNGGSLQQVIITGGEPFMQLDNLAMLVRLLHEEGFVIQIETNGACEGDYTLFPFELVGMIVCSPKGNELIHEFLIDFITHYKFLTEYSKPMSLTALAIIQRGSAHRVFLQPIYVEEDRDATEKNAGYAAFMAQEFGCRLSLQMHKYIGIP